MMHDLWMRLERFFAAQGWSVALRPGATEAEIVAAEATLGLTLPADLRASLCIHDGEDWRQWQQCVRWMIHDAFLLPVAGILEHWKVQQTYYARWGEDEYADDYQDEDRIRNVIFHPRRIPIANNLDEESGLWLDFTPGPAGVAGQVIMDITECEFIVLAPTFHAFLARYLELLETGVYFSEAETYGCVIPQNLDALHNGAIRQDEFYRRMFLRLAHYRVRYFFDAGSGVCLWGDNAAARADYGIAITPDQLPLPPETRQEVERLVAWYDTSLDWNYPVGPTPWSPEEGAHFNRAAQALSQRLQVQLGPVYEIVDEFKAFDEALQS